MSCFRNYSLIFCPPYLGSAAVLQAGVHCSEDGPGVAAPAPALTICRRQSAPGRSSDNTAANTVTVQCRVSTHGANIFNVPQNIFNALTKIYKRNSIINWDNDKCWHVQ